MTNWRLEVKQKYQFLFLFSLLVIIGAFTSTARCPQHAYAEKSALNLTFTYHYYSEIYHNENQSIFVYDGADTQGPLRGSAFQCTFKCEVQQVYAGFTAWTGAVAWASQPLAVDVHVVGDVVLRAWMSSTDDVGAFGSSGYGGGITETDENGNILWNQYDYKYSMFGKAISNTPTEYTITLSVDHIFQKGHTIGFGVGAGSTKKGWIVNVFFDSSDRHSRASVPCDKDPFSSEPSKAIIDKTYVSGDRVNVGRVQAVGFHAKWHQNGSDVVGGSIYVNGTEHVTNGTGWVGFTIAYDTVGKRLWTITSVSCHGVTAHEQVSSNPCIIWDRIKIVDGDVSRTQTNITQTETIWFKAAYEYDGVTFDGSKGTLYVNGSAMKWSTTNDRWEHVYSFDTPGTRMFKISGVSDSLYGLTAINDVAGAKSITWSTYPPPIIITIICSVSPEKIIMDESITVSGSITPAHDGVTVALIYKKPDGSTLTRTVTTKSGGFYSDTYKPDAYGSWSVSASWAQDHEETSSSPASFAVEKREKETPVSPWESILFLVLIIAAAAIIIGAAALIIGVAALILIVRKRRQ